MHRLSIGVVGCGSGGPAAAALLAMDGHDVVLFEEAPELSPVGAGILLQPTGMEVLDQLGVLEDVLDHGAPVDRLFGKSHTGRVVIDIPYADIEPGLHGLGMYRPTLLTILVQAMADQGADLELGTSVAEVERVGNRHRLIDRRGRAHGPFDLLILADGSRSELRAWTGLARRATEYPWGALFFIGEEEAETSRVLAQVFRGSGTFIGLLPTGHAYEDPTSLLSMFWSVRNDRVLEWRREGLEALKDQALELMPHIEPLLDQIDTFDELVHARYLDVVLEQLTRPGLACIGDHAHAMSPQLGQGVNMALLDAMALADAIAVSPHLPAALSTFDASRRDHLAFYQPVNRISTPFFQSDNPLLGWMRDHVLSRVGEFTMLRRQQALTMAGLKTGPFSAWSVTPNVRHALSVHADAGSSLSASAKSDR